MTLQEIQALQAQVEQIKDRILHDPKSLTPTELATIKTLYAALAQHVKVPAAAKRAAKFLGVA